MIWGLLVMVAPAQAAPCDDWSRCPIAANLHPVSWSYGRQYQEDLDEVMAGPKASPLFSSTLSKADIHWRLLAATGRGLDLEDSTPTEWRDLALAGVFLSSDQFVSETVSRSEEAEAVRGAFDTLISPSAELVIPLNKHPVRLSHTTGWGVRQRLDREEEAAGLDEDNSPPLAGDAPKATRHPPIRIGAALGWKLRDLDAPGDAPLVTWNADLSVHNAILTLWRVDLDLIHLHWDALVRERLFDGVSAGLGAHSEERGPLADRWSAGLYWIPQPHYVVSLQRTTPFDASSVRYDVSLRVELGAFLPGRLSPSLAGLPAVVDTSPNRLVSPTVSPTPTSTCAAPPSSGT